MGLDMYLTKKTYFWSIEREKLLQGNMEKLKDLGINPEKVKEICEEAGYWRKANAIHQWFVENIQHGEDNCAEYYVSSDDLKKLLDLVNKVLDHSKLVDGQVKNGERVKDGEWVANMKAGKVIEDPSYAEENLPTTSGFFFGSTGYDEYYYQGLLDTKTILESAIKSLEDTEAINGIGVSMYYQSSW